MIIRCKDEIILSNHFQIDKYKHFSFSPFLYINDQSSKQLVIKIYKKWTIVRDNVVIQ